MPVCQQGKTDFVIENKNGKYLGVQVKKLTVIKSGNNKYLQARLGGTNKSIYESGDFDYLALTDMNRVWMIPFEAVRGQTSISFRLDGTRKRRGYLELDKYLI